MAATRMKGINMKIVIEGTYTTPNAVFMDSCLRIGRKTYSYEDITDVRSVSAPARLVNGLVQLSTRDGEVLHVTYFLRDTEKMRRAMQTLMPYVKKNKEQRASSAFVETDIFGDHSSPGNSHAVSIADEIRKLAELRDKGDLSQEEFDLLKKKLISRN